ALCARRRRVAEEIWPAWTDEREDLWRCARRQQRHAYPARYQRTLFELSAPTETAGIFREPRLCLSHQRNACIHTTACGRPQRGWPAPRRCAEDRYTGCGVAGIDRTG